MLDNINNKSIKKSNLLNIFFLLVLTLLLSTSLYAITDEPLIKISTGLGVETEISLRNITLTDQVLTSIFTDYVNWNLTIEISDGIYIGIPFELIQNVLTKDGLHFIKMKDGKEFNGKLLGKITTTSDRTYDLSEIVTLNIIDMPENNNRSLNDTQKNTIWELKISGKDSLSFNIIKPLFAFQYYSSSGYMMGGSTRETSKQSFYLKVEEKEHLINIDDFIKLTLTNDENTKELNQLTVESKTGIKTKGLIILKEDDDAGDHEGYNNWFLTASMAENKKILIAINKNEWTISKK